MQNLNLNLGFNEYESLSHLGPDNQIVCPYCLWKNLRSNEEGYGDLEEDFVTECGRCEKPFLVNKSITVYYSSFKKYGIE